MSGLIALLDDVAALTRVAASSLDDVASMAAKAGTKAAGVIIDDAAVTPKYVTGLNPKRELPIIWKIARASFFSKLVILLPVAMLLNVYAPFLLIPLLMLGGLYLCFEGAEKIYHVIRPHSDEHVEADMDVGDPAHLEETRVKGAIKTDFILSAEIMTISLNGIVDEFPDAGLWLQGATLAAVAIAITIAVYGTVALIVKMDDVGAWMALKGRLGVTRAVGTGLVKGMPHLLTTLSVVGTAAMLWVGGSILVHGVKDLGAPALYETIKGWGHAIAGDSGFGNWAVVAGADGIIGLAVGLALIPIVTKVIAPLFGGSKAH